MNSVNTLGKKEFCQQNEEFSRRFDVERFLNESHFLIRFVELKRVRFIIQMLSGMQGSVLDIGCGSAFLLRRLTAKQLLGIDLSFHNVTEAKKNLKGMSNSCVIQADAELLPFADSRFDAVLCSEVIEHVQNPGAVLKEAARTLKDSGTFIITVPNDNLVNFCKLMFKVSGLTRLFKLRYGGAEERHLHIFTKKGIIRLLNGHGYRLKGIKRSPFYFLPLRYVFLCTKDGSTDG